MGSDHKLSDREKRKRLWTELHVADSKMSIGGQINATVVDSKKYVNIPPFKCNCLLTADRESEIEKIKSHLDDCKEEGVCKYLMRLND